MRYSFRIGKGGVLAGGFLLAASLADPAYPQQVLTAACAKFGQASPLCRECRLAQRPDCDGATPTSTNGAWPSGFDASQCEKLPDNTVQEWVDGAKSWAKTAFDAAEKGYAEDNKAIDAYSNGDCGPVVSRIAPRIRELEGLEIFERADHLKRLGECFSKTAAVLLKSFSEQDFEGAVSRGERAIPNQPAFTRAQKLNDFQIELGALQHTIDQRRRLLESKMEDYRILAKNCRAGR